MNISKWFQISVKNVRYLILDEADRMLDMGFGPEVRKIVEKYEMPGKMERQTLMFSATFPEDIQRLAKEFLNNYLFVTVGRVGSANTDIQQAVHQVAQYGKRDKLIEILNDSGMLQLHTLIINIITSIVVVITVIAGLVYYGDCYRVV